MRQAHILVVEDDQRVSRFLKLELEHAGFDVTVIGSGSSALEKGQDDSFDLIILDVMLPGFSGLEVCRMLRENGVTIPVIMLTALDTVDDTVSGLDSGASDYLAKPFSTDELLARIRVQLRIDGQASDRHDKTFLQAGPLLLSPARREAWRDGTKLDLTRREFDLLEYLIRNKGLACSRDSIIEKVWGFDFYGDTNVVDVYIRYLRRKLEKPFSGPPLIHTIRGVGYCLRYEQPDGGVS